MSWYFIFFFVSGFCSILYEVIWLRLAMAQFGVTTAMVSIVLSAFMGGLGLGSWGSGYLIRRYGNRFRFPPLRLYAITELLIGVSAIAVPYFLFLGRQLLQQTIFHTSSAGHYLLATIWVTVTLVPWCACMGATFPFAMLAIRNRFDSQSKRSFSFLYLANVLGAVAGAIIPLLLIELLGFHGTLYVGAALNFSLASCAFGLTLTHIGVSRIESDPRPENRIANATHDADKRLLWLLFGTGLTSMGAEVIWIRLYTPSVSTVVYSFAAILATYLAATYLGSWFYRRKSRAQGLESGLVWAELGFSVLLPFLTVDPRLPLPVLLRLVLGVVPFSSIVGFVTPMIVDSYCLGDPDLAGDAYAINIVGCVIGPLLSGFLLLPLVGERLALCLLAFPWFIAGFVFAPLQSNGKRFPRLTGYSVLAVSALALAVFTEGFEEQFNPREVLRDNTATVIATGSGRSKQLLINGVGITSLLSETKMMAHLPLALLPHRAANALIICFGMGTSHRSALSWHIQSTAVELVPSVPALFSFFHPDGTVGLDSPLSHVVIDDGRSYLERTQEKYDVIVIDPPPPIGAAASSLLYSKEFYAIAKERLRPGGILQQWLPGGDAATQASVARALKESFPHVRVFPSVEGWGFHFLASMTPIPYLSASDLAGKLPSYAARDLMEWGPASNPQEQFGIVLSHELSLDALIHEAPNAPALQDDHPVNEYFVLRRLRDPAFQRVFLRRLLGRGGFDHY
jgi:predicted membrane-bound spermidine synthase